MNDKVRELRGAGIGGTLRSESEEHIIEMKGLGLVARDAEMDYARMRDGSETISWAQSGGAREVLKGGGITKTMEITVKKGET